MKIKGLAAAVAAGVVSSQALALPPTANVDLIMTTSGATAADIQFANYINQICDASTLDTFNNPSDSASAFSCTVRDGSAAGISGDRDVLFRKESGGSSTGVEPVTNATDPVLGLVAGLDLSTCTEDTPGGRQWTCSDTTIDVQAQVGISDVEPELFAIPANGSRNVNLAAPLSVFPVNAQTFGIVVTTDLRDALQTAQGLNPGSDEISDMPSLSSAVIANLFAGNIAEWSQLGLTPDSPNVEVCVRRPGSGTQAQFNTFYMGNACLYRGAGNQAFLGLPTALDTSSDSGSNDIDIPELVPGFPLPPPYIHQNIGSSDMGRCLTNLDAQNRTGIGIQSLEKVDEGRTDRNNFKYIAVDGVTPSLANVASGLYQNWATLSIQWRTDVVTGEVLALANELVATAQDVGAVATFNASLLDDSGTTTNDDRPLNGFRTPEILDGGNPVAVGSLALAQGATQPSIPWNPANPVLPFNKGLVGPSACAAAVIPAGTPVDVSNTN